MRPRRRSRWEAHADAHLRADLQELHADAAALGTGQLGALQPQAAQGAEQYVGEGREVQADLVGTHGLGAGAIGEEIELLLFDSVLHLSPRTVFPLVQRPCIKPVRRV